MSLHPNAALTVGLKESVSVAGVAPRSSTPPVEALFDAIQVCEISLSVVSRHQFDAWVHGPLNSLIPHIGLFVWPDGLDRRFGGLGLLQVESAEPGRGQLFKSDTARFALEARRRWLLADRVPVVLNAKRSGGEWLPRISNGGPIVIQGVEPLFGGAGGLFALVCESTQESANVLFMTQLIAPYLLLAVRRIGCGAQVSECRLPAASIAVPAMALSSREIEILECVRNGKSNAEIGAALNISPYTVKSHLQRTFRKLGVSTRTQAVSIALSLKVLDLGRQRVAVVK